MANGDKTPTWQYVANGAISLLMIVSSVLLYETRADIKDGRKADALISERVTSIEKTMPLQFDAIKEWREEIRISLERIANNQSYIAARAVERSNTIIQGQKSAAQIKEWNKIK